MTTATVVHATDMAYVRDLVWQHSANVLDDSKTYLVESRLGPVARQHGHGDVAGLVAALRRTPHGPLHDLVVDAMTTNETSFFRDNRPFEALTRHVLPDLIERRRPTRSLTLWSAACSSGQEPFSIAMLLRERFPELAGWHVRILATDLSAEMLDRAASGRFTQLEVNRGLPAAMLVRWFHRDHDAWRISDEIRGMVEFRAMNLVQAWPIIPPVDVVFLRNVLIYFDLPTKQAVLARVRRTLRPDGSLFMGAAETTLNVDDQFERFAADGTSYYRPVQPGA